MKIVLPMRRSGAKAVKKSDRSRSRVRRAERVRKERRGKSWRSE